MATGTAEVVKVSEKDQELSLRGPFGGVHNLDVRDGHSTVIRSAQLKVGDLRPNSGRFKPDSDCHSTEPTELSRLLVGGEGTHHVSPCDRHPRDMMVLRSSTNKPLNTAFMEL